MKKDNLHVNIRKLKESGVREADQMGQSYELNAQEIDSRKQRIEEKDGRG